MATTPTESSDDTLDLPRSVLVACPLERFAAVRVADRCIGCPHFDGLADRFPGGPQPFATRYAVRCKAEPVQRTLTQLIEA